MIAEIPEYHGHGVDTQEVVYIEYQDNYPHSIYTMNENGRMCFWDAFPERGDKKDLRLYNSGSGGTDIQAPCYIDSYKKATYWKSDKVNFNGIPKNITQINEPIIIENYFESSRNPFKIGEITYSSQYCNVCERKQKGSGWSTEYCDDHTYTDDNGDLRYFNHKYVN